MKPSRSYRKHPLVSSLAFFTLLLSLQGRHFSEDSSAIPTLSPKHVFVSNLKWEEYILEEVNRLREEKGLGRLKINPKAQAAARDHSLDMAKLGYFSHTDLQGRSVHERLRQVKLGMWKGIAENIAKCDASSNPAQQIVDGWTKSPGSDRVRPHYSFK